MNREIGGIKQHQGVLGQKVFGIESDIKTLREPVNQLIALRTQVVGGFFVISLLGGFIVHYSLQIWDFFARIGQSK
jgi:hypothetical protein